MKKTSLIFLLLFLCMSFVGYAQKMTIATYNLRNDNQGDSIAGNGWQQRCPIIANLIQYHDFDIFGTQECFYHQLENLVDKLPGYAYIGVGRDDGKKEGEHSAVFYKTDKFKLLENGDFWLSQDTKKPNLGWDAACVRICSWGRFEVKETGFKFLFFNLHMDHVGVTARRESAKLILSKIKEMAGDSQVILTGDFNVDQKNESYTLLNTSGILKDSYEMSPIRYELNGTFNNFRINLKTDERIDHIFLTNGFRVSRHGILTECYWTPGEDKNTIDKNGNFPEELSLYKYIPRLPSDHYPVVTIVEY